MPGADDMADWALPAEAAAAPAPGDGAELGVSQLWSKWKDLARGIHWGPRLPAPLLAAQRLVATVGGIRPKCTARHGPGLACAMAHRPLVCLPASPWLQGMFDDPLDALLPPLGGTSACAGGLHWC